MQHPSTQTYLSVLNENGRQRQCRYPGVGITPMALVVWLLVRAHRTTPKGSIDLLLAPNGGGIYG
jgi:hypothetical protein